MLTLQLPNITGKTVPEQVEQMRKYLFQLVEYIQVNQTFSAAAGTAVNAKSSGAVAGTSFAQQEQQAQSAFNSVKSLIIKSAEIVDAYYAQISKRLDGSYVAQSEFGTYKQDTSALITANADGIKENYANIQELNSNIDGIRDEIIAVDAHIKRGLLEYDDSGIPIYGVEVGQTNVVDGEEIFRKFARFTADRLSFYDANEEVVAYISDYKLHITHVEIGLSLRQGAFLDKTQEDGSIITKWVE